MGQTKDDILATGTVANQESLVKRMLKKKQEPRRLDIPGGATMLQTLDSRNLDRAIYNWLRSTRWFETVKINLVNGSIERPSNTIRIEEFPTSSPSLRPWDRGDIGGKRWLAERMAQAMSSRIILSVEARPDGLYITVPKDEGLTAKALQSASDWDPHCEFVLRGKNEYAIY